METDTIFIMGGMLTPLYGIGIIFLKKTINNEKCLTQIKTALRMKFPDLVKILK